MLNKYTIRAIKFFCAIYEMRICEGIKGGRHMLGPIMVICIMPESSNLGQNPWFFVSHKKLIHAGKA